MSPSLFRGVSILLVILAVACSPLGMQGAENTASITGEVMTASGEPAVGGFVKIKNADQKLTFLVISQGQGRFRAANLPPGKYQVQATGGGMQSDPPVSTEVAEGQHVTVHLTLNGPQPEKPKPLTASDYDKMLVEGKGLGVLKAKCTSCHDLQRVVVQRKTREEWEETLKGMIAYTQGQMVVTEEQNKEILDYLLEHFGANSPSLAPPESVRNSHFPKTWLRGAAAEYIAVEQAIDPKADTHDVSVDSKGIGWVNERTRGLIGRFDPQTLTYSKIPIPAAAFKKFTLNAIAVDPQDRVWAVDGGPNKRLVQYDPETREFNFFPLPDPRLGTTVMNTIRFHPDGSVWGTQITANQILRLDPLTKKINTFLVPAGVAEKTSARPYGMAIDGNQKIWFAENALAKVGRLDPATGEITEYDVPARSPDMRRMDSDAEGNLWFGVHGDGKLGKVDHRTGQITLYEPPTPNSGPYSVSVDKQRNLIWFCQLLSDSIARFDPRTNTFVEFSLPTLQSDVRRIEVDPSRPSRVWFSGSAAGLVGYIEVLE